MFGNSTKELSCTMKGFEKVIDPQLWHACAGGMVQMPSVNSKVYYFPQGHAEHAKSPVDFGNSDAIPSYILSRVTSVKFMADPDTDEVFAKIRLVPVPNELDSDSDKGLGLNCNGQSELQEKPASFAKTLTQSDANNGGGFSVPRYCAETIFPRLDYSADPPVQTVLARDVHGDIWKFRHIYRGTPRRHLLTTGWSTFVNQKRLVAGDSIVFLRTKNGELCVGIRRAKKGIGGGPEHSSGWSPPIPGANGGFPALLRSNDNGGKLRGKGRVNAQSVIEAVRCAGSGQAFEVMYYPRASTPEFCVKAASVGAALRVRWCSGMRFKMAFETEDASRISWFMGTVSSVQVADPSRWPSSPWRLLQVAWDEPDLLQNVKRVSPWLVELVSNMPTMHLASSSPPRKKLRILSNSDFSFENHQFPNFSNSQGLAGSSLCCHPQNSTPVVIQGTRHSQYGSLSLSDLHFNRLQSRLFHAAYHPRLDQNKLTMSLITNNPLIHDDGFCSLTIGCRSMNDSCSAKKVPFLLFGQPILTEEQISLSSGNSSSDGSAVDIHHQNGVESFPKGSSDN